MSDREIIGTDFIPPPQGGWKANPALTRRILVRTVAMLSLWLACAGCNTATLDELTARPPTSRPKASINPQPSFPRIDVASIKAEVISTVTVDPNVVLPRAGIGMRGNFDVVGGRLSSEEFFLGVDDVHGKGEDDWLGELMVVRRDPMGSYQLIEIRLSAAMDGPSSDSYWPDIRQSSIQLTTDGVEQNVRLLTHEITAESNFLSNDRYGSGDEKEFASTLGELFPDAKAIFASASLPVQLPMDVRSRFFARVRDAVIAARSGEPWTDLSEPFEIDQHNAQVKGTLSTGIYRPGEIPVWVAKGTFLLKQDGVTISFDFQERVADTVSARRPTNTDRKPPELSDYKFLNVGTSAADKLRIELSDVSVGSLSCSGTLQVEFGGGYKVGSAHYVSDAHIPSSQALVAPHTFGLRGELHYRSDDKPIAAFKFEPRSFNGHLHLAEGDRAWLILPQMGGPPQDRTSEEVHQHKWDRTSFNLSYDEVPPPPKRMPQPPAIGEDISLHVLVANAKLGDATRLLLFNTIELDLQTSPSIDGPQDSANLPSGLSTAGEISDGVESLTSNLADTKIDEQAASSRIQSLPRQLKSEDSRTHDAKPLAESPEPDWRIWSSRDGRFSVEAEFVSYGSGEVRLKRKDSYRVIKIPLDKLSEADQKFVNDLKKARQR